MALDNYVVNKRPSVTAFAFGRAWYAGVDDIKWASRLFFSQVMTGVSRAGKCYVSADPTAEDFNAQIASDGGYLNIPDIGNIIGLFNIQKGLVAIADNGVWVVIPGSDGFSPTAFIVSKVSEVGGISRHGTAIMEGTVMYTTFSGINQVTVDKSNFGSVSVTEKVIDSFYRTELTAKQKEGIRIKYDQFAKKLWCFYDLEVGLTQKYLQFNARKSVWTKGTFKDASNVAHAWLPFTTLKGNPVNGIRMLLRWDDLGAVSYPIAEFNDSNFYDFGVPSADIKAYLEFSPIVLDNPQFSKSADYVSSYFSSTEQTWEENGEGGLGMTYPSGVEVTFKWDYSEGSNLTTSKISKPQQGYRIKKVIYPDSAGVPVIIPEKIQVSRLMIRGKGKALTIRYDSQTGKDFRLEGFSMMMDMDGSY